MLKIIRHQILFLSLMSLTLPSLASDNLTGKVIFTGLYGDGRFFIQTDRDINELGCERSRIDVAPNHPQISHWLSISLAAYTTGGEIQFKTRGCYGGYPTLDTTDRTWLHSKPQ
ncbi:hypothetical protein [Enterovibrio norvegicus]|uniref:Uncharacterized protein n=1 Tax=Enterovibrio norvegicus TaxID=188144 RepID=A0ABV4KWX1_9GAMM|nr:hypothetical protein [Enterovibrio norvegicus]